MRYLLGELVILDVHYAPLRFKYRLHGTKLVTRTGFDMTGKWVDEWPTPQYRARLLRAYTATVEAGESQRGERRIYDDGRPRQYEFLILPLAPNGSTKIDKLLVAVVHLDRVAGEASDIYQPAELAPAAPADERQYCKCPMVQRLWLVEAPQLVKIEFPPHSARKSPVGEGGAR
jgi:hypothetical protein